MNFTNPTLSFRHCLEFLENGGVKLVNKYGRDIDGDVLSVNLTFLECFIADEYHHDYKGEYGNQEDIASREIFVGLG